MKHRPTPLLFCLIALVAVTFLPPRLDADHAWLNFHWARSANPVNIAIGDNMSALWAPHLDQAVADWHASSVLALSIVSGGTEPQICAAQPGGRVEVCSYSYGLTGWLGIAKIGTDGDHIVQALAAVNDTYFVDLAWLYGFNTPEWRQSVLCQEIGHTFGLNHQDENFEGPNLGSCMDYTNDPSGTDPLYGPLANTAPNDHDYLELESIYLHLDGKKGGKGGGGGGRGRSGQSTPFPDLPDVAVDQLSIDHPSQWGRLIRAQGRLGLFERDLGLGNRVFTFVVWAD